MYTLLSVLSSIKLLKDNKVSWFTLKTDVGVRPQLLRPDEWVTI